jgi:hypothetical protein
MLLLELGNVVRVDNLAPGPLCEPLHRERITSDLFVNVAELFGCAVCENFMLTVEPRRRSA